MFYDQLKRSPGKPITLDLCQHNDCVLLVQLQDFYGLDIRQIQRGSSRTGRPSIWVLAGEWFGRVYVDYIAQHIESQSAILPADTATAPVEQTPFPSGAVAFSSNEVGAM